KPHLPFNAPKRYWDMYRPEDIKLADNPFIPKDAPSYATTNWGELRNYYGIPKKGPCSDELARQLIHGYYACISYIDAMVGRLLDELERLRLIDKTVIILWGDHGWKLGEHAGWCKHTNFELDTRVPMILSVPGMKTPGRRTKALTEYVDIYPTLCEACGLALPGHLEGLSMMPLLHHPDRQWKKAAFSQYPRGKVMGYTMRTRRFRYTEWQDRKIPLYRMAG
ncbi:MAG: sulfatase-like hydrolase/transferase, partial [Planctomycetota bacterium]